MDSFCDVLDAGPVDGPELYALGGGIIMDVGRARRVSSDRRGAMGWRGRGSSRDFLAGMLMVGMEEEEREGTGAVAGALDGVEGRVLACG